MQHVRICHLKRNVNAILDLVAMELNVMVNSVIFNQFFSPFVIS